MPFTLAHPAAIAPVFFVYHRRLVLSALIIGSMSPDFEYLLRLEAEGRYGHTPIGLLVFCVPIGWTVYLLFHYVVKRSAVLMSPRFLQKHFAPHVVTKQNKLFSLSSILFVSISLLIGAVTHVVWDAFTHKSGWFVRRIAPLSIELFSIAGHDVHVYKLLQHGCSLFGLSFLVVWFWHWLKNAKASDAEIKPQLTSRLKGLLWAILFAVSLLGGLSVAVFALIKNQGEQAFSLSVFVVRSIVGMMTTFSVTIVFISLALMFILPHPRESRTANVD